MGEAFESGKDKADDIGEKLESAVDNVKDQMKDKLQFWRK